MSLYDEPKQVNNTGHILGDGTSRVWREVKDSQTSIPSTVLKCISWCCFSSIVFKVMRIIGTVYGAQFAGLVSLLVLMPLSMVLYNYLSTHERRFTAFVWLAIVTLGFVIGGL